MLNFITILKVVSFYLSLLYNEKRKILNSSTVRILNISIIYIQNMATSTMEKLAVGLPMDLAETNKGETVDFKFENLF